MQSQQRRSLILIGLLVVSGWLLAAFDRPAGLSVARWPTEDALYAVDGWTMGPITAEAAHGTTIVSRSYRHADGTVASVSISTSPEAKRIYRAGAEVPFLGNGYLVDDAPPSLVTPSPERRALMVRREGSAGLLLYAYGERRGLLGNGIGGWGAVVVDAVQGRPNDYYLVRLFAPLQRLDGPSAASASQLADTLLPRLAAWYAR